MSALVTSILAEDLEGARSALDAGASANAIDPELQRAPLPIAVSPGSPRMPAMVELLVSRGADLNAEDAKTRLTPLMAATIVAEPAGPFAVLEFQKSKLIVERLLNLGADPARATQAGETPLLVAVAAGNMEVLRLLIARGARPDQAGAKGETPLARATRQKRTDMAEALIAAGAQPLPPRVAARGVGAEPDIEPVAADAAATGSSGISGWLIGGLAVAAGVVAAAVLANAAKKRPNPPAPPQPSPAPQPQLPVMQGPVIVLWLNGGITPANGLPWSPVRCVPAPGIDPNCVMVREGDIANFMVELGEKENPAQRLPLTVQLSSSEPGVFPVPATLVVPPRPAGQKPDPLCMERNPNWPCIKTRIPLPVRVGAFAGIRGNGLVVITAADPTDTPKASQLMADVGNKPPVLTCVAPQVLQNGACITLQPIAPPVVPAITPVQVFRDCADCPEMVLIPVGSFMMGSPQAEAARSTNEDNQHTVTLARPFAAGRFEVTFDEWDACLRDKGCSWNPGDNGWGRGRRPVIDVTWDDAKQYTAWLSRKTGKSYGLLTEAQWEYAARAGTVTEFNTGPNINSAQANFFGRFGYAGSAPGVFRNQSLPVGQFAPNAFGLHDVHGNVYEWTEDCWNFGYNGAPGDGSAWLSGNCSARVHRGGSWQANPQDLRSASRQPRHMLTRLNNLGFRVARSDSPYSPTAPSACVMPQVLQNGMCVTPSPIAPPIQPPPVLVPTPLPPIAPPIVVVPPPVQGPIVVLPPPVLPAPLPVVPPVVVSPAPTPPAPAAVPVITNVTPANMAALFRLALNGGSDAVTVSWSGTGPVAVSDVAIAYTWSCASGPRAFAVNVTPAPGASSAVLRWFASGAGIGCPELGGAGPGNAPTSAVINLTYKANGVGPDLVVSRPFGQIACLTFYPDDAAFPVNVPVSEVWSAGGGSFPFNRQVMNPYGMAAYSGLADATLDNAFRVCGGRFISAAAVRNRAPTAADAQSYRNVVQAANGMITLTEQVMRPGAMISENAIFTTRYSIATGEYSFSAMGGQRNGTGGVSALNASRAGQVRVRVDVSGPQDPGYVPTPPMADTPQPLPICAGPMVLDGSVCVATPAIPVPALYCAPPTVMQNGACVTQSLVCTPPQVMQNGVCVTQQSTTRIESTPKSYTFVPGMVAPQFFLWQMNSKILAIGLPKTPLVGGVVTVSGIGTTILMVTLNATGPAAGGSVLGVPSSYRQALDIDLTLEVPLAGSPPPYVNSTETINLQSKSISFGTGVPQVFTQKVRSKIVQIFDVKRSPEFGGTVRYEGIGTDTLTVTAITGGSPGSTLADFSAQVMY